LITNKLPQWAEQAIKDGKYPVIVTIPIIKQNTHDNRTEIVGLGSKSERSLTGHKSTQEFINSLRTQAVGKPLFVNHDPSMVAGRVTRVLDGKDDEFIPVARLNAPNDNHIADAPRAIVQQWIDEEQQIGYSYGAIVDKVDVTSEDSGEPTFNVGGGKLKEMSVTLIPALESSGGTVKTTTPVCPNGMCDQMVRQIENGMNPINTDAFLTQAGDTIRTSVLSHVRSLIQSGNYTTGSWDGSSCSIEDLKEFAAVSVSGKDPDKANAYKYPLGKNGKVSEGAISSAQGYARTNMPELAGKLEALGKLIDKKEGKSDDDSSQYIDNLLKQDSVAVEVDVDDDEDDEDDMVKCPNCGGLNSPDAERCTNCGYGLSDDENEVEDEDDSSNNQNIGVDNMVEENKTTDKIEINPEEISEIKQGLGVLLEDMKARKEAEAKAEAARLEQEKIDQAVKAKEAEFEPVKEELEGKLEAQKAEFEEKEKLMKESFKELLEESVQAEIAKALGSKVNVGQTSREASKDGKGAESVKESAVPKLEYEKAKESMTVPEMYKTSNKIPAVVFGQVQETAKTPTEFFTFIDEQKRNKLTQ